MTTTQLAINNFFDREEVRKKFELILKDNASSFITSVLAIVSQSSSLAKADPKTVYMAALTSASQSKSLICLYHSLWKSGTIPDVI